MANTNPGFNYRKSTWYGAVQIGNDSTLPELRLGSLAVTREGIPVRSWVLPGNITDVSTVEKFRVDLRGWNLGRAMFLAGSGMNCQDNRSELAKACGKYLLACRMANVSEIKRDELTCFITA